ASEHDSAHDKPIALFDLVPDYGTAKRIALAFADGTPAAPRQAAIGFFQSLGLAVSAIDDTPGLIVMRIAAMLANEAAEAVLQGVAAPAAIDLAMIKGVSYPHGPLAWADEIGIPYVVAVIDRLAKYYPDGHYRASALLRRRAATGGPVHGG
ncbi:MAG: 3-hydroxyacyl-CoA dehydrogenase, partial [Proteobacteria bacterium]|nr:3-hydroxyacyl-CoA dehydrogenase [Pseudomonadota bacterium]